LFNIRKRGRIGGDLAYPFLRFPAVAVFSLPEMRLRSQATVNRATACYLLWSDWNGMLLETFKSDELLLKFQGFSKELYKEI